MKARVRGTPDVVERDFEVVGPLLAGPHRVQGLDGQAEVVAGIL